MRTWKEFTPECAHRLPICRPITSAPGSMGTVTASGSTSRGR